MRLCWNTDLDAWSTMVRACPDRTFYHDGPWLGAVAATRGTGFDGALVGWPDGRVALLPLVARRRLGLMAMGHSGGPGAYGGYGGLLASAPLARDEVEAVYRLVARACPNVTVLGNPFAAGAHLPEARGAVSAFVSATRVVATAALVPPPPPEGLDLLWIPGPQEFQADRFCALPPEDGRPRAFYYHLFARAREPELGLLLMQRRFETVAAALVGLSAPRAHLLGLRGDPALKATLLAQLPRYMPARVETLDLGPACPTAAVPPGWKPVELSVPGRVRRSLPTRLFPHFLATEWEAS